MNKFEEAVKRIKKEVKVEKSLAQRQNFLELTNALKQAKQETGYLSNAQIAEAIKGALDESDLTHLITELIKWKTKN